MKLAVSLVVLCLLANVPHFDCIWMTYGEYFEKYGDLVSKANIIKVGCTENLTKDPNGRCRELY